MTKSDKEETLGPSMNLSIIRDFFVLYKSTKTSKNGMHSKKAKKYQSYDPTRKTSSTTYVNLGYLP